LKLIIPDVGKLRVDPGKLFCYIEKLAGQERLNLPLVRDVLILPIYVGDHRRDRRADTHAPEHERQTEDNHDPEQLKSVPEPIALNRASLPRRLPAVAHAPKWS
jgi:hypothetical protein